MYAKMTDKERAEVVHELFPADMTQLILHCRGLAEDVLAGKLVIAKWLPHSAAHSWQALAAEYVDILKDHQEAIIERSLDFGNYLCRKRIVFFTRYCVENFLDFKYSKNQRFILALRLFLL